MAIKARGWAGWQTGSGAFGHPALQAMAMYGAAGRARAARGYSAGPSTPRAFIISSLGSRIERANAGGLAEDHL